MDCWTSSFELRKHVLDSLKELNLAPSKQRGQNFLVDSNIINFQINHANIQSKDVVLEIGGGIGNLSKCLASKAKKLIIIEQDKRLVSFLASFLNEFSNVEIIQGDAVKVEFPRFDKCVSNLPYQISSPITFKILEHSFDLAVLMYQKEFANRFFAEPGTKDYSRISVMINLKANCKNLKTVKPGSFYPQPKIYSSIVSITKKEKTLVDDYNNFSAFVRALFSHKKKTIRTILLNIIKRMEKQNVAVERTILDTLQFIDRRVFTMSIEELVQLYNHIRERIGDVLWSDTISPNMR
jgi:16S rRNA (adenine1518-N6/adenine1519-N6)-dimethyltransferase